MKNKINGDEQGNEKGNDNYNKCIVEQCGTNILISNGMYWVMGLLNYIDMAQGAFIER